MAVLDKMFGNLGNLTDQELEELLSRLEVEKSSRANVGDVKGLLMEDSKIIACPHCGSVSIVKCGKKDGKQRYKCKEKECGKTFMQTTSTMFSHTRLNREQWLELLRGMVEGLSINKIADNIGMSGKAVWYNKNKVLTVLSEMFIDQDRFVDIVECDEYSVHLSFKGKKDPRFFIYHLGRMPRHNRSIEEKKEYLKKAGLWDELQADHQKLEMLLHSKNRSDNSMEGAQRDSVCILTGKDRSGNLFAKLVCVGSIARKHVIKHFDDRFESDAIMVTDGSTAYVWFAEERNLHHVKVNSKVHFNGPYNLSRINSLHSNLSKYWSEDSENLPATKYLDLSLMLFWWQEKNKDLTTKQQVEELYAYISSRTAEQLTYEKLQSRVLQLDTKGLIPTKV